MRGKVPKFIKTDESSAAVLLIYRFLLKWFLVPLPAHLCDALR
jgi:hypothetical protein